MEPAITLAQISTGYGNQRVLDDISITIPAGSFYCIIGHNGSGKTTLLKTIAGILNPHAGRLHLQGKPIGDYSRRQLARHIAFVPQLGSDGFPFTVKEIVLMGRTPHQDWLGTSSAADIDIAQKALTYTGLDHLAHRRFEHLSGGERQRVFIARAICQQPRVMILDEPTAALDLAHQVRIMDLMEQLRRDTGMTVVMVSHDINLAAMYADILLLLKNGRPLSQGAPESVLTYANLERAYGCILLVDTSPMGNCPRVTLVPRKYQIDIQSK